MPRQALTLPELDQELAGLAEGSMRRITRCDYERLFGLNDVALGRLRNFARSHACVASFADGEVLFRKEIPRTSVISVQNAGNSD